MTTKNVLRWANETRKKGDEIELALRQVLIRIHVLMSFK